MDDIAGKISELLSDPDGMNKIKSMAENLFKDKSLEPQETNEASESLDSGFSLPDGIDIGKIMTLMSAFNNQKADKRSQLLLALKPHLCEERRERVDKAVKLLKIIALLPLLREQGLLDIF